MNLITRSAAAIIFLLAINACMPEIESDMDKVIERDDQILSTYLAQNNIVAQRTQVGYYYSKELEIDGAPQIKNNSVLGIYYNIKTIDGQVIDSHTPEDGLPRIFMHGETGIIPRVINFAASLAKEGEILKLYAPSYLAYGTYGFQQLILPNSNLDITVHYAKVYTQEEIRGLEDQKIQEYIAVNELEGFTKTVEGAYIRILEPGEPDTVITKEGSIIRFNYELFHINETEHVFRQAQESGAVNIIVGSQNNLKFLNVAFLGLTKETKIEMITPSHLAYGPTLQVIPEVIRKDLLDKELIQERIRPYHPLKFIARVKRIS